MTHHHSPLSRSVRKHIRIEKARLRKAITDPQELYQATKKLYQSFERTVTATLKK